MPEIHPDAARVLDFWFVQHTKDDWFGGKQPFDAEVRIAFAATLVAAERCECAEWRGTAKGRLAEIIVLDQFSRQLYRRSVRAFANDPLALALAQEAVRQGADAEMTEIEKQFLYLPFMHSESLAVHETATKLYAALDEGISKFEEAHRNVLLRFGRFPMRNEALGRPSTAEETAYMAEREGSMF